MEGSEGSGSGSEAEGGSLSGVTAWAEKRVEWELWWHRGGKEEEDEGGGRRKSF